MSKISETPRWENEIHALTRGEKVEGGRGGAANIQASQLGNRTAFLKNELEALGTLIKSGDMPFASEEAAAAAINEGKIPDGAVFSVRSSDPRVWVAEYKNVGGEPVKTGRLIYNSLAVAATVMAGVDDPDGTITGIASTFSGQLFRVITDDSNAPSEVIYINDNGEARFIMTLASGQALDTVRTLAEQASADALPLKGTIRRADIGNLLLALVDEIGLIPWQVDGAGGFGSGVAYISKEGIRAGALQIMSTPDAILRLVGEHGIYSDLIKKDGSANFPRYALGNGVYLTSTPDAIIRLTDRNGLFYDIIDKYGVPAWLKKGNDNGGGGEETTEATYIRQQNAVNLSVMEQSGRRIMTRLKFPSDAYNHFIMQCQSLGMGFMCFPAVSKAPKYGNLMLGNSVRPASASKNEFAPLGDAAFQPLKSVVQSVDGATILTDAEQQALGRYAGNEGESPIVGAVNGFRRHFLEKNAFSADNSRLFVASAVGLSGQSIASLLDDEKYYQRFVDCVTKAKALADSEGKSYSVTLLAFMQGERDYQDGTSKAVYKGLLGQLRTKMLATIRAITGQADDPVWLMYQTGYVYTPTPDNSPINAVTLPIGEAQYEFCQENKNCLMVGPNYQLPDKQGHLMTNGSRWMGCYFAKVADRVLNQRRPFQPLAPRDFYVIGNAIYNSFLVEHPPLKWQRPFRVGSRIDIPNKGFRVFHNIQADAAGIGTELTIASVEIVADTIVKIVCTTPPVGTVRVLYGSKQSEGQGMLTDSDDYVPDEVYEYDPQFTQWPEENIAELIGKPYPMENWCIAFSRTFTQG